jgi:hypothetical protein
MIALCKFILLYTSFIGIYETIRILWVYMEIKETGSSTETYTDTIVTIVLSLILLFVLFIGSY